MNDEQRGDVNDEGPTQVAERILPAKYSEFKAGAPIRAFVPQTMEDAFRIANVVSKSGLAPKDLNTPEKCMVAIMHGMEIGLTPMQALQRIAVINGRPCLWGDAAIALVRASGKCEYVVEVIDGEGDKMVAVCKAKRKGEPQPIIYSFSVSDATTAGLWGKAGPWKQYPKRMLQMRARGFTLRDGFADVLGGLYLAEELQDGEGFEPKDITPPKSPPPVPKAPEPKAIEAGVIEPKPKEHKAVEKLKEAAAAQKPRSAKPYGGEKPKPDARAADESCPPFSGDEADAYLEDLAERFRLAPTLDDVEQIWDEHVEFSEVRMFPPDKQKARDLHTGAQESFEEETK